MRCAGYDRDHGRRVGRLLDEKSREPYGDFLRAYPASAAPFEHEVRVHLFGRNRNAQLADAARDAEASELQMRCTIAFRQNRILEHHFPTTLAHSGQVWSPERRAGFEACEDPTHLYTSGTSKNLILRLRPLQLACVLLAAAGLFAFAARLLRDARAS